MQPACSCLFALPPFPLVLLPLPSCRRADPALPAGPHVAPPAQPLPIIPLIRSVADTTPTRLRDRRGGGAEGNRRDHNYK